MPPWFPPESPTNTMSVKPPAAWLPEQAHLRAPTDGFVVAVAPSPGQPVRAGKVLVTLDDPVLASDASRLRYELAELVARRDQTSGVNVDEELVDMIQFEQAYGAASRFIQVLNSLHDEILNLL